ncbi:MAG TPA: flagellar export chaperone FliS [Acidimicrobiales bacterium]|nr:flagellar export chaperone FliS [Acidimicrobiales bacterium]
MTASQAAKLRERYLADAIETAAPPVRLTMLYDALEQDLSRADTAFETGDLKGINDNLVHAQAIILTLRDTIKPELWDGAPRLIALYDFFLAELLGANLTKDRQRAASVSELIGRVGDAWRKAAVDAVVSGEERVGGMA